MPMTIPAQAQAIVTETVVLEAVSYTHLDVYKRQVHSKAYRKNNGTFG